MTSRDFCYWLQGYFEVGGSEEMTKEQVGMVQTHLNLVFVHEIDPSMGDEKHQNKLNDIHNVNHANSSDVTNGGHGECPHEGWSLSTLHGWYDPEQGIPRC